ncbi:MAG: LamB/YcsF family protein, partial [Chloroflexota bacterium]
MGEASRSENFSTQDIVCKDRGDDPAIFSEMHLAIGENLVFQFGGAKTRVNVNADFTVTVRMRDGGQVAIFGFPAGRDLFERRGDLAGGDEMPAPVVEAGDVPTVFEAVVEQEDLAQEIAGTEVIVCGGERTHDWFDGLERFGFGRRNLDCTIEELATDIIYQIGAIQAFCAA